MIEIGTLKAERRTQFGKRVTRNLRAKGFVPAVIYGQGEPPVGVVLLEHDVEVALDHGARTLTLDLDGKEQQFLIKDVQYDHLDHLPLHLDLMRFRADERVTVTVGVELRGVPKGVNEGGILEQYLAEVEVECLVTDIPDTLHPLVTELGINDVLYAKDIELPPGVKLVTDGDERVAAVREGVGEAEAVEEETPEGEEAAQPEVIGRGKKEEEEDQGTEG